MSTTVRELCAEVHSLFEERYGKPIGAGRNRIVFLDGDFVLKVPRHLVGCYSNEYEADTGPGNSFCADCFIDKELTQETGIPILRMEYVEHVGSSKEPDWTWSVDGGQVGRTKDGRLVAYDWERR